MMQKTFAMIKPHAVAAKNSGDIIKIIELNGFTIIGMRKELMSKETAENFYGEHKERPFFGELVSNITSGPVILMALEKEDAVKEWRDLMGPTNPIGAPAGTLRRMFGTNISFNAVHGSDAPATAQKELGIFFPHL